MPKATINYRVIDDVQLAHFLKSRMTKVAKKVLGVKTPILGKNRGRVMIPKDHYSQAVKLYMNFNFTMPEGELLDAKIK
jgi:hypothetical protein